MMEIQAKDVKEQQMLRDGGEWFVVTEVIAHPDETDPYVTLILNGRYGMQLAFDSKVTVTESPWRSACY